LQPGDELPTELANYLNSLGYQASPVVEDIGQYSLRGGIIDLFSPAEDFPVRIELFGDQIESMRKFSIVDQRSLDEISSFHLIPIYEFDLNDENIESIIKKLRAEYKERGITPSEADEAIRSVSLKNYFSGSELLLPYAYEKLSSPLDHFSSDLNLFFLDPPDVSRAADEWMQELENDYRLNRDNTSLTFGPDINSVLQKYENIDWGSGSRIFNFSNLSFLNDEAVNEERINYSTLPLTEFSLLAQNMTPASEAWFKAAAPKISGWLEADNKIFVSTKNPTQTDRLKAILTKLGLSFDVAEAQDFRWQDWLERAGNITLIERVIPNTIYFTDEKMIFLRSDDFFGKKQRTGNQTAYEQFSSKAKSLALVT